MRVGARKVSPSGIFYCVWETSGVGVVAHPQGPLAHGPLLPVGFQSILTIGLGGKGVEVGAHLWMGGTVSQWVWVLRGPAPWGLLLFSRLPARPTCPLQR